LVLKPDARLREMYFGAWELRPWAGIARAEFDTWLADFVSGQTQPAQVRLDGAAAARGFSIGNRCVPSIIVTRPLARRAVLSVPPTCFISADCRAPTKASGHLSGWRCSRWPRLWGMVS
jgi:hypothetical protein